MHNIDEGPHKCRGKSLCVCEREERFSQLIYRVRRLIAAC